MGFLHNVEATKGFERRKLRDPFCFVRRPLPAGTDSTVGRRQAHIIWATLSKKQNTKAQDPARDLEEGSGASASSASHWAPLAGMNDGAQE